ncbi:MAG: transporter substrate-binding domain-containing protein [Geminocystis sp.]|nr:transporter substrate-binding domain-containing protein [Geminocystis sp.]HIK37058.1 transporter substrate-binding domain-containing protein [Geminocystis sp. M7585_C2015_104]MCS7148954.1 transporter substrate-binding domain-containing protein [Geminocystis sp.]MCX8077544.1 transporter substrate-binding domain-containing protein [Geminocystis sp.]MDW8117199.1 transporter substrate-binding domain-containing protein [Geminocystis sp.]
MKPKGLFFLFLSLLFLFPSISQANSRIVASRHTPQDKWVTIQKRGKFIVGVKDNLPPLAFRDGDGNLTGFEIDIARGLARELLGDENAISFVPLFNQQRLLAVINHQVDFVIASVTLNPSRQRVVDFSDYYYLSATGIVVKANSPFSSFSPPTLIAVLYYSRSIADIQYHLPQAKLRGVTSYQEALELMERGEIEAFAGDVTVLTGWIRENPNYRLLPTIFGSYPLAIVFPKGRENQHLQDKINQVIRRWKREGWLKERARFWGLPTGVLY